MIQEFKNEHHSDIVNVIYLSDGDGNNSMVFPYSFTRNMTSIALNKTKFGVTDAATKVSVLPEEPGLMSSRFSHNMFQASVTELVQEVTGARHIGYYFGNQVAIIQRLANRKDAATELPGLTEQLTKNGYVAISNLGYSNYYYVDVNVVSDKNEMAMFSSMNQDQLFRAFSYNQKKKANNKLIARQFAAEVAE
jgi:hypothetical protein